MEINGLDKVLVDTSAWIDYFRKKEPVYSRVSTLLDDDKICCVGLVMAELIQGVKNRNVIKALEDFTYVFTFLEESAKLWAKAGELSFTLKKAGKQIGLADCYIAIIANSNKVGLLTLDSHFTSIKEHVSIGLL